MSKVQGPRSLRPGSLTGWKRGRRPSSFQKSNV